LNQTYAEPWRRLVAQLIDGILFTLVFGLISGLVFGRSVNSQFSDTVLFSWDVHQWFEQFLFFLVCVVMWVRWQATPGKLILGCYVVDADTGQAVTWLQAGVRYLAYFVSLLPLGLGFLWILWDKRKQGFHDKLARTVVVNQPIRNEEDESQKSLRQLLKEMQ